MWVFIRAQSPTMIIVILRLWRYRYELPSLLITGCKVPGHPATVIETPSVVG